MRSLVRLAVLICAIAAAGACSKRQPPAPAPTVDPLAHELAARRAAARADSIRRDSIAQAERLRRDGLAREEAAQQAAQRTAHLAAVAKARATMAQAILFAFDEDTLTTAAMRALDAKAQLLSQYPDVMIRVNGHADEIGSDEYNMALGQRRAAAARRYLIARGVLDSRLAAESFGEQRPACDQNSEICHEINRRDEFEITAGALSRTLPPQER